MLARRLLILLAVLMGLTALAAGVAPRRPLPQDDAAPPQASTARPVQKPLVRTLSADEPSGRRIEVNRGRLVRLTVEGDVVDSVQLGDLQVHALDPESPVHFELIADVPGSYPITLVDAQQRLGVLEVQE
jgi:hypothetical protein